MDVQEAITDYLTTLSRLEPLTCVNYAQRLRVFSDWIAEYNKQDGRKPILLETLTDRVVNDFVEHLKKTHHSNPPGKVISSATLVGYVRQVKIFLRWCLEDETYGEGLKESQVRKIKMPKEEKFIKEIFTDTQLEGMRKACEKEYNEHMKLRAHCVLALLTCTGIRANELCTLKIQDVHLDSNEPYIKVHGKGNKWREVPLINLGHVQEEKYSPPKIDHQARELLQRYKDQYRSTASASAPFLVDRTEHNPFGLDGLQHMLNRLEYQAEITEVPCNPHRFRHTFAARFMFALGDIYLLSKMLGHATVSMTERYLKSISGTGARMALLRKLNSEK